MKVLITGSEGLIGSYLVRCCLGQGNDVIGIDNVSKGMNINLGIYELFREDILNLSDDNILKFLFGKVDYVIHCASLIGGIGYFHKVPYDIIGVNNIMMSKIINAAIFAHKYKKLKKIVILSSSMIYESVNTWPSKEGDEYISPPPISAYGFQKLGVHYYCQAAYEQYGLPYVICVPFNAVGVGEYAEEYQYGVRHVIPDFISKCYNKEYPVEVYGNGEQVRCFTYCEDLVKGIVLVMLNGENESFNIANSTPYQMIEVLKKIHYLINPDMKLEIKYIESFKCDVQKRIPDVGKIARKLGFTASTTLDDILNIVTPWYIEDEIRRNNI